VGEVIAVGPMRIEFILSKDETGGCLDMFRVIVPPSATMPVAHWHRDWEETLYGLEGAITVVLEGAARAIGPGDSVFVSRGAVHNFYNASDAVAIFLSVLTPGVLGPAYFREIGAAIGQGRPDPGVMREIMLRHGLVPAP